MNLRAGHNLEAEMARLHIACLAILAAALAAAAWLAVPRAIDAAALLAHQDDPAALADRQVARILTEAVVAREIEAALAADDADLARSFVELARAHQMHVDPALAARVTKAVERATSPSRTAENFAKGFVTGEPHDPSGLAGTALGDLFVFGDVRDAVREGVRFASGEEADHLILGLACVGLAVTAGTYASLGGAAPLRAGLTVAKAARKTGRLAGNTAGWLGHSMRQVVDARSLGTIAGASITQPAVAIRAAREAVKLDRAGSLVGAVRNIGRVQSKAGSKAAFDGLRIARGPKDMARIARLAEKKRGKTRAILKLLGRGAIVLAAGSWQLLSWIVWAIMTVFGFVLSTKGAVERYTLRRLRRRRAALQQDIRKQRLATPALGNAVRA